MKYIGRLLSTLLMSVSLPALDNNLAFHDASLVSIFLSTGYPRITSVHVCAKWETEVSKGWAIVYATYTFSDASCPSMIFLIPSYERGLAVVETQTRHQSKNIKNSKVICNAKGILWSKDKSIISKLKKV